MTVLETLNRRYATKQFDKNKKISDQDLDVLLKSIQLAPTAYGLQPFKAMVVTDQETKNILRGYSWDQSQVSDCSHLIVFSIIKDLPNEFIQSHIDHASKTRNISREALVAYGEKIRENIGLRHKYKEDERSTHQTYVALGFLVFAAAEMHIDACPMEGFDPNMYDQVLDLGAKGLHSAIICALGYRSSDDQNIAFKKIRRPIEELISFHKPK